MIRGKYVVIKTSFEGADDDLFSSVQNFCGRILGRFAYDIRMVDKESSMILMKYHEAKPANYDELSRAISQFIEEVGKDVVLLIDEVDKSSNSKMFLQFLGLLRIKQLPAKAGGFRPGARK